MEEARGRVEARSRVKRPVRGTAALIVVGVMVVAALSMWTIVPLGWIWIGSMISDTQEPSGGPYMLVFVGIVISILILSWLLGRLNRLYVRITGSNAIANIRPAWMKGMTEDRFQARGTTVLETVVVTSVTLALVGLVLWFFFLAGSPLPSQ
jgi:hypothetical protein